MKDLAQFLKVLADEARLEILWLLFNHEELCVCDLMEALEMTQSKTSRHLATLRHAGLVVDRREAAWSYYSLRTSESELERNLLQALRVELGRHPGAARVLQRLRAQMARKCGNGRCVGPGHRAPARPRTHGRVPRSGTTR